MGFTPFHIRIKSAPENLIDIRHTLSKALAQTCLSKEECGSIILAVDEACSNIIRHSYKNDHTQSIAVSIEFDNCCLTITVKDKGIEFDPTAAAKRDITEIKPGGLGIYIIHQVMDKVEYTRTPDGYNRLKITKKLLE